MPFKDPEKARLYARDLGRRRRQAEFEQRKAEIRVQIDSRPAINPLDCAWAAGLFEGEGTMTIVGAGPHHRCLASVTSTDPSVAQFFQDRWPGKSLGYRHSKPQHRPALVWTCESVRLLAFICDVGPHLRTDRVREKFAVVEEAQWLRRWGNRDDDVKAQLAELRSRIRVLNQRGLRVTAEAPQSPS